MTQGEEQELQIIQSEPAHHIIQLIPAQPGWEAVWSNTKEPEKGELGYYTEPVVCWALIEESDGSRVVTAMMPDLESSELKIMLETSNFLGYASPSYSPNWMKLASDRRTEIKSQNA